MHDLNMLNEHLDQLHIRLYGPTPKNDEIKGGGQLLGAMGIHELSRTLKNAASNALDRLNNVEQQL
jgi:hypothetical protein